METKHTLGPWEAKLGPDGDSWDIIGGDGLPVAEITPPHGCHQTPRTREKNARLIAAAPDLLKVVGQALRFLDDLYNNYTPHIIPPNSDSGLDWDVRGNLREAIYKATGS